MTPKIYLAAATCMALLASCASAQRDSGPAPLTEKNGKFLAKVMKDRVAGEAVNCVSSFGKSNLVPVSDDLIIYRPTGSVVYQNKLKHPCPGLGDDDDILLVEKTNGSQFCKGDRFELADRFTGGTTGICRLGEFVPYRKVKG